MAWATSKNRYKAILNGKSILVDLFDLPYADFNEKNPLIVEGPVVLTEQTRTTDFSNVFIEGGLDISKQKAAFVFPKFVIGPFICRSNQQMRNLETKEKIDIFNGHVIYPQGITEIDCSHSISKFADLGNIPNTVTRIIVADSMLANLGSNTEKLKDALDFQQKFSWVEVLGDRKKQTLSAVLSTAKAQTEIPQEIAKSPLIKVVETKETQKPEVPFKNSNFCDEEDIFKICGLNENIKTFKILDSILRRKIRNLMEKLDTIKLKDKKTGAIVVCIKKTEVKKLIEILKADLQKRAEQKTAETQKTVIPTNTEVQTKDFTNINEIIEKCIKNETIIALGMAEDIDLIKAKVRKHIRTFDRRVLLNPATNSSITCISTSNVEALITKVVEELKELNRKKPSRSSKKTKTTTKETKAVSTPKTETKPVPAVTPVVKVAPVKSEPKLKPVVIKKYIPENLWKAICNACGKNIKMRKRVLENISAVNMDISETKPHCHLHIIQITKMAVTSSSCLRRKSENCVIQSIRTSLCKDNKRIVWSYNPEEKILVCTDFYLEHTKAKSSNNYDKACELASKGLDINERKITMQLVQSENYLDVEDLLKEALAEMSMPDKTTTETRSGKRARIHISKPEKVEYTPHQPHVVNTPKKTTKVEPEETHDIVPVLIEPKEKEQMPKTQTVEQEAILNIPVKPENMTAVQAIQTYFQAMIKTIEDAANQELIAAASEQDIAKQLHQIDDAREIIVQKTQLINLAQPQIDKICTLLKQNTTIKSK